jgi:hypothetical protein
VFKGFLRLSVVLSVLALIPIMIFLIKDSHRHLDLGVNPHLGMPNFSFGPFETDLCVSTVPRTRALSVNNAASHQRAW